MAVAAVRRCREVEDIVASAAALLGVDDLWRAVVKPATATPARVVALRGHKVAATVKLNGVRALALFSGGAAIKFSAAAGATRLEQPTAAAYTQSCAELLSVIDCEEKDGKLYGLDVLVHAGQDVRSLGLRERLEKLKAFVTAATPDRRSALCVKPYRFIEKESDADLALEDVRRAGAGDEADGLIVVAETEPYWSPPLKFKFAHTCDLLVSIAWTPSGALYYRGLVVGPKRALVPWHERAAPSGRPGEIVIPCPELEKEVDDGLARSEHVVVECARDSTRKCFVALALRPDRVRPNRAWIVAENVRVQDAGLATEEWIRTCLKGQVQAPPPQDL